MTRKEFTSKSEALSRLTALFVLVCFTIAFTALIALGLDLGINVLLILLVMGYVIGIAYIGAFLAKRRGLLCPTCRKALMDKNARAALLTGKCPGCRNKVFSDDTSAKLGGTARKFGREEFAAKFEALTRQLNRRGIILIIVVLVCMSSCVPFTKFLLNSVDQGKLDWVTPSEWTWVTSIIFGLLFLSYVSVFLFRATGKLKTPGIPCPECSKPLFGAAAQVAIEDGFCVHCGEKMFD